MDQKKRQDEYIRRLMHATRPLPADLHETLMKPRNIADWAQYRTDTVVVKCLLNIRMNRI